MNGVRKRWWWDNVYEVFSAQRSQCALPAGLLDRFQRVASYLSLEYNLFLELLICIVA
jgi:hypothetical protein